jgi:hypothetical protein
MHVHGLMPLDKDRRPAIAAQQLLQLVAADARQHGRVGDLVAVQVQDRQHSAVAYRVEKLVGMPGRGQRAGLCLAIADHASRDQLGVVEHRTKRVAQGIAQLATFMDGAGALGRNVARNAARERELPEQLAQPLGVLADVGVDLAVAALQVGVGHHSRAAVARPGHIEHVQVVMADHAVQMRVDEVLPWCRAPVAQQHALDVGQHQGAA